MKEILIFIAFIVLIICGFLLKCGSCIIGGYNNIDNIIYDSISNRRDDESISDLYSSANNVVVIGGNNSLIKKKHNWYKFNTWKELNADKKARIEYIQDRNYARSHMTFDWKLIYKKVMPYIYCKKTHEYVGVIRAESNGKSLYVHKMESSNISTSKGNALRYVPANLVSKYSKIPSYFMFHTHPANIGGEAYPSDIDIYSAILNTYYGRFVGEIVVSEYGIIIYYLSNEKAKKISQTTNPELSLFHFCYDIVMAWNVISHKDKFKLTDQVNFLKEYGVIMMVIPTPNYVAAATLQTFTVPLLTGRFRTGKYELLDKVQKIINEIELEEEIKNKK